MALANRGEEEKALRDIKYNDQAGIIVCTACRHGMDNLKSLKSHLTTSKHQHCRQVKLTAKGIRSILLKGTAWEQSTGNITDLPACLGGNYISDTHLRYRNAFENTGESLLLRIKDLPIKFGYVCSACASFSTKSGDAIRQHLIDVHKRVPELAIQQLQHMTKVAMQSLGQGTKERYFPVFVPDLQELMQFSDNNCEYDHGQAQQQQQQICDTMIETTTDGLTGIVNDTGDSFLGTLNCAPGEPSNANLHGGLYDPLFATDIRSNVEDENDTTSNKDNNHGDPFHERDLNQPQRVEDKSVCKHDQQKHPEHHKQTTINDDKCKAENSPFDEACQLILMSLDPAKAGRESTPDHEKDYHDVPLNCLPQDMENEVSKMLKRGGFPGTLVRSGFGTLGSVPTAVCFAPKRMASSIQKCLHAKMPERRRGGGAGHGSNDKPVQIGKANSPLMHFLSRMDDLLPSPLVDLERRIQ